MRCFQIETSLPEEDEPRSVPLLACHYIKRRTLAVCCVLCLVTVRRLSVQKVDHFDSDFTPDFSKIRVPRYRLLYFLKID